MARAKSKGSEGGALDRSKSSRGAYIVPVVVLIRLFYAGAVIALLILLVAFGVRTFYAAPEAPRFPESPDAGFAPVRPVLPGELAPTPTAGQLAYQEKQRAYSLAYAAYEEERADYHRDVFLIAAVAGLVSVVGGLALHPRLAAIRLGLVAGGLGTLLYGIAQAGEDLDEIGSATIFVVALIGLVVALVAGHRWLASGPREPSQS